ncbi:Egl nine -like protein 1 [Toxocara canis]|uniref:Egl nine-like protein 1 n=1 Tax=Toxocara canis TaxID=6265 RepID=A0A0B2UW68_TOXCA|nr:Egl nine -like protein 1 [Toxocara canis]
MPAIVTTPVTGTFEKSLCLNADVQQTKKNQDLLSEDTHSKRSSHIALESTQKSSSARCSCHPSLTNLRTLQLDEGCSPGRGQKVGNTVFSARTSFSTGGLYNLFAILPTEEGNKDSNDQRSASLPSSSHFQSLMGASSQKKGCAFCGVLNALNGGPLVRCQHCNMVAYCGEEHQKFDWKRHKPLCKTVQSQLSRNANSIVNHSTDVRFHLFTPNSPPRTYLSPDSPAKGTGGECASTSCSSSPSLCDDSPKWAIRANMNSSSALATVPSDCMYEGHHYDSPKWAIRANMNSSSALATVPSASPDCVLRCRVDSRSDMQSPHRLVDTSDPDIQIIESRCSTRPQRVTRKRPQNQLEMRPVKDHSLNVAYQTTLQEHLKTFASSGIAFNQHQAVALRLMTIAEHVIRGLNEYGWALVDNFLGLAHCHHLYQEMEKLYLRGLFSAGQLMANKFGSHSQDIRSDEIYWFESGDERARDAVTVRLLVSMIDSIIVHFNGRIPNKISGRSRIKKQLIVGFHEDRVGNGEDKELLIRHDPEVIASHLCGLVSMHTDDDIS